MGFSEDLFNDIMSPASASIRLKCRAGDCAIAEVSVAFNVPSRNRKCSKAVLEGCFQPYGLKRDVFHCSTKKNSSQALGSHVLALRLERCGYISCRNIMHEIGL
ncbi:uncharacterized protein TRIVIDRAFT_220812 [Trichoderma virens Gv29-8]|uniref:Uncharacterized protein n=1 Tax=Hypocrea virens (strain Gv29-8 / FGSC 10586) TaxID=413071 RepID=G9MNU9_HYPVG|nr:uncharacterized protein TRIVIDRAFT_220812 [Trichoderma virens Gv29-8]EHK23552.1 hypothetical protein TRIVIDRAFT_220812 [Trichoderma virens Gv29-8]UKZ49848.1 hypothetical protein TrVGV298_004101 [Trichoderma virens]